MGQFEYESSNLHIAYPFEQPGIVGLNDAFADALVIDSQQGKRVRLNSLSITDWAPGNIAADITYSDSVDFFGGAPTVSIEAYGAWQVISFAYLDKRVQLVMNGAATLPITVATQHYFVARVCECDPKAINSVEVTDGVTEITHVLDGDIELSAGYNIMLQQTNNVYTDRAGAVSVALSAVPGAGFGVAPSSCVPDGSLRSINAVGPDKLGRFVLNAQDCYRAIVPSAGSSGAGSFDPTPATVQLFNDCSQCCKCTDYENCYKALKRIHDQGRKAGIGLAKTIDDLKKLNDTIKTQRNQRRVPAMDLLLRPQPGYILGVQINLMNNQTRTELFMNKDSMDTVLVKMFLTSDNIEMNEVKVLPKSCYVFNSRYGNPWIRVKDTDIMLDPVSFTDLGGVGMIIKAGLAPQGPQGSQGYQGPQGTQGATSNVKPYHVIAKTHFVSIFFELFWPSTATPEDGDKIKVKLVSTTFKPYTLIREDTIIKPFEGTV